MKQIYLFLVMILLSPWISANPIQLEEQTAQTSADPKLVWCWHGQGLSHPTTIIAGNGGTIGREQGTAPFDQAGNAPLFEAHPGTLHGAISIRHDSQPTFVRKNGLLQTEGWGLSFYVKFDEVLMTTGAHIVHAWNGAPSPQRIWSLTWSNSAQVQVRNAANSNRSSSSPCLPGRWYRIEIWGTHGTDAINLRVYDDQTKEMHFEVLNQAVGSTSSPGSLLFGRQSASLAWNTKGYIRDIRFRAEAAEVGEYQIYRDPFDQPYHEHSVWNLPRSEGILFEPINGTKTTEFRRLNSIGGRGWQVNYNNWTFAKADGRSPGTPVKRVDYIQNGRLVNSFHIHIPEVHIPTGLDRHLWVLQPDGTIAELYKAFEDTENNRWTTTYYNENDAYGHGLERGSVASAISHAPGIISHDALLAASQGDEYAIKHVLRLGLPMELLKLTPTNQDGLVSFQGGRAVAVWPARWQDTQIKDRMEYKGAIPMGSYFGIPSSTPMPDGLSNEGKALFRALQDYGMYVLIQARHASLYVEPKFDLVNGNWVEDRAHGRRAEALKRDWQKLWQLVHFGYQHPGQIDERRVPVNPLNAAGGGGEETRRRPFAPPLAPLKPNVPPTVELTAPSDNAIYFAPASITITANATDEDGSIAKVEFFNGNTLLGETLTSPYSFTWNNAGEGNFIITARATDNMGAVANSAPISIKVLPKGSGLSAVYYNSMNLTGSNISRTDATVDFNWGTGAPATGIGVDRFSARWTGHVLPKYTELYTFHTITDDGVRLWINGQLLIDNWVNQPATERSGTIALEANKFYDIRMEYFENRGHAVARLLWSSASQAKEIIPQSQLYPVSPMNAGFEALSAAEDKLEEATFVIYPNPSSGQVTIQTKTIHDSEVEVEIRNINGIKVYEDKKYQTSGAYHSTIDLGHLPKGVYLLYVKTSKEIWKQKIVMK
jgi:hypothetical protein